MSDLEKAIKFITDFLRETAPESIRDNGITVNFFTNELTGDMLTAVRWHEGKK